MKTSIYNHIFLMLCAIVVLTSCDAHRDFPDTSMKAGHILCTDGQVYTLDAVRLAGKQPIAVVFYVNNNPDIEGGGYAVYLHELPACEFADSLGISQGTSCDLTAHVGNANTYALYSARDCSSPLATAVFDMWRYGQSAYIPSVAQLRLLYNARSIINPIIEACGGDVVPTNSDSDWVWSSTEVEGQQDAKAWLYSLSSGAMQECPKNQPHISRPIITINR